MKLSNTLPLSTCEPIIHDGLKDVGVDSVFWININRVWGDLYLHPDAAPLADIRAHEEALRVACSYNRENLLFSRTYLEIKHYVVKWPLPFCLQMVVLFSGAF